MYPLLLKAPLKDYIWGGTRLKEEFGFDSDSERIAEAWVLSCHADGKCRIINGYMKDKTLDDAIKEWGSGALGEKSRGAATLPILVKLIDAKDRLSVQVHPSDDYALSHEGDNGKTELWYVIDCCEGAELVYGLKRAVTKDEFRQMIESNTLDEILNYVPVHKGDSFFIQSGTVHAIGAGILIAEIQENSNLTYRVSDYGRLGADGKPRELHIDKAIEVSSLTSSDFPFGNIGEMSKIGNADFRRIISCEYFTCGVVYMNKDAAERFGGNDSFVSLVVLKGSAEVIHDNESFRISKGDSVFIPAGIICEIRADDTAELLYSGL